MNNASIAQLCEDIAVFLELKDDNPFRIRAYLNAARNIRGLPEDIAAIASRGELTKIPGIGADLKLKVEEFLSSGSLKFHKVLLDKTPRVLVEMLKIQGMGPKTANLIYKKYRPKSLADLEKLVLAHKLRKLPGIREKTEQNILETLNFLKQHRERTLLSKALPLSRQVILELKKLPQVDQIAYAGSLRRMQETVRDIDILVTSKNPTPIMKAFVGLGGVQKVLAHGETKSSVISREGIQIDLRVVSPDSFGAALLYFTGSKAHNIKLRTMAKKKGLKINEYGLFKEGSERRIAGKTEEEIYRALGLDWISPELREDYGEVEASAKHRLPCLVERADIRGDFHTHSNWSDGLHKIEEMVEAARKRKLSYMVLTDHSQSLKVANGLSRKRILAQIATIKKLNRKFKDFTLLAGSEVDILQDGSLDFDDDILKRLDFVIASVHTGFKQSKAQITKRILRAMENKHVHAIGHPTGRLLGEREAYEVDLEQIFKAAEETNTALEINSQPTRLDLNDVHARQARDVGVALVVDTDSHAMDQFENLEYGIATARRAWCEAKNILNCLTLNELQKRIAK